MAELLYKLGRFSARRPWAVVGSWIAVIVIVACGFIFAGGKLGTAISLDGTPTDRVTKTLQEALPDASRATGTVVFHNPDGAELTDEQRTAISLALDEAADVKGVETVVDPFQTEADRADQKAQLENGREQIADARTQIAQGLEKLDAGQEQLDTAQAQLDAQPAPPAAAQAQLDQQQVQLDQGRAELEQGQAELEANVEELEYGTALMDYASGIRMVSEDGSAATGTIIFTASQNNLEMTVPAAVVDVLTAADLAGAEVDVSSSMVDVASSAVGGQEGIGIIIAAIVLLVMLGTIVAAGLPILMALVGVAVGALGVLSFSGVVEMISVTPILGLMLGLAVGIDYSLFILNRHRQNLRAGVELKESIALANGTSGNAVVFAGATVIIALAALNVTGIDFLGLMGTAAAVCVAVAVLAAVTLAPALISLAGMRLVPRKMRASIAAGERPVQKELRPLSTPRSILRVIVAVAAMIVVAIPALSMRLGIPDGSSEALDSTQYQAYTVVEEKFGAGLNGPLVVVANLQDAVSDDDLTATQATLAEQLAGVEHVSAVAPIGVGEDNEIVAFQLIPDEGPTAESTEELVHELRGLDGVDGVTYEVAGQASGNIDISEKLGNALPLYLALVVGLSLVIMLVVFRSIWVPLIATAGFMLSIAAAMGGVVAIFQWGWLGELFGVHSPAPVLSFLPVLMIGILFGLAMDYQLFLVSGMREAYAHGTPARLAVVKGMRAARTVVVAAAIIMISVFSGFIFSHMTMIKPIGFGLAFGVLVDAFLVRMVIMPALMHLLGEKAWWLPKWLDRILPNADVEGAALERRHETHAPAEPERELAELPSR